MQTSLKKLQFNFKPSYLAVVAALAIVPVSSYAETAAESSAKSQSNSVVVAEAEQAKSGSVEALPEVSVKASNKPESSYQPLTTVTAAKIEAPLRDIPQTVNVVTSAVMRDQGALTLQDALRNVPGVGFSNGDGQRDQVNIRGFTAIGDQFVDGIRDDALYFRDLSNVEQVEVLKGPAAVLYGRGSSGGIINRVTKKPLDRSFSEITAIGGTTGTARVEADINQKLGDSASFRINGAYEDSDSFRQQGFVERSFIAPSLLLKISDQTKVTLQLEHLDDRRVNDFGMPAINGRPVSTSVKTYYGSSNASRDDYVQSRVTSGTVVLEHILNDDIKIRNAFRAYNYDLDRNNTVATSVTTGANPLVNRRYSSVQRQEDGIFNQTDLTIKAEGLGIKHTLLFGVELAEQNKDTQSGDGANPGAVSLYNPVLTPSNRASLKYTTVNTGVSSTTGLYAQDLVTLNKHWKALVGVRYDSFDQDTKNHLTQAKLSRKDEELSPRAGLVYQPNDVLSFYGSYTKSFQPSQETFALAANNADMAPEETKNYEIGSRLDMFDGNVTAMASLYRLERTNIKTTDPANNTLLVPVGEQRTDGLELSVLGRLAQGLDLTAGYALMDGRITKSNSFSSGVALEGNRSSLTPEHSANLWLTKRFSNGFGIGGGAVYMGDQFASASNLVKLPGYTRFDATAFYETKKYDIRLAVNNIFDKRYFISAHGGADLYNTPGAPMNALLSLRLKF